MVWSTHGNAGPSTLTVGPFHIPLTRPKASEALGWSGEFDFERAPAQIRTLLKAGFFLHLLTAPDDRPWPAPPTPSPSDIGRHVADWLVDNGGTIAAVLSAGGEAAVIFGALFDVPTEAEVDGTVDFSEASGEASP